MSNQVATIPATVRAEAYEMAKQLFGVSSDDAFSVSRKNAKGAVTTRTELGVSMSGNKEERAKYTAHVALRMWAKSQILPLAAELFRVFPKLQKEVDARNAAVNNVLASNPELAEKLELIRTEKPRKVDLMAMFAMAQTMPGADKGEKAKLLAAGRAINEYELAVEQYINDWVIANSPVTA